ncbi:MAG: sigma-70 family RNA polymerase sigma factor [Clostridium sp.]|nr:sigma-70 family RNA polymerase sigma factor [Clostridium sp.]MCM1208212.1 sigma-70 family RNA polymerase sigma factor [Ruminococcus sp.]
MTYEQAVEQAKMNNDVGFRFLYESTYKDKYYVALKYMQNEQDALDVLQDAYMRAFKSLDTLYEASKFSAWMGMIVANTAKNALSSKKRQILFSDINTTDDDNFFEEQIEDDNVENQPELAYTKEETKELVNEMIQSLSEEQRLCIMMFYIENMSINEIAYSLDCSENTVKSRLSYGRKNLRTKAEDLERKGYRLHGIAPLTLLAALIRSELASFVPPAAATGLFALGQVGAAANIAGNMAGNMATAGMNPVNMAGNMATAGMNPANVAGGMETAGMTQGIAAKAGGAAAKKAFLQTVGGKLVAGIAAAAVLAGGTAAIIYNINKDDEKKTETEVSTEATDDITTAAADNQAASELDAELDTTEEVTEEKENTEYKQAYVEVLKENESYIKMCESWYASPYSSEPINYGERPVAVADVTGDDMPELIILSAENEYATMNVEIYSFNEEKNTEQIFSYYWDMKAGSGQHSALFTCSNSASLYFYVQYGDTSSNETIMEVTMGSDGRLQTNDFMYLYENYEQMYENNTPGIYEIGGSDVTKEQYEEEKRKLFDSIETVYQYNTMYDELNSANIKNEAMTYEEALEFLGEAGAEKQESKAADWKSSYLAVLNDPESWLRNIGVGDETLNGLRNYEYSLFDINHNGTPELIISAVTEWVSVEWFFCSYSNVDGAYLIEQKSSDVRTGLGIYNNQLVWSWSEAYSPNCGMTYITMTMGKLESGESFSYESWEERPETESLESYPIEDTSALE